MCVEAGRFDRAAFTLPPAISVQLRHISYAESSHPQRGKLEIMMKKPKRNPYQIRKNKKRHMPEQMAGHRVVQLYGSAVQSQIIMATKPEQRGSMSKPVQAGQGR